MNLAKKKKGKKAKKQLKTKMMILYPVLVERQYSLEELRTKVKNNKG